jgi:hypothetical protein
MTRKHRVPNLASALDGMGPTDDAVEALLHLTANQLEARGTLPGDDRYYFEVAHTCLASVRRELKDTLAEMAGMPLENGRAEIIQQLFGVAVLWAYQLGSASPDSEITKTKNKTGEATRKRAQNNEHWAQPFNKAIRQAHRDGLIGKDAVNAACKSLGKMPVGNKALLSREHELRTGKKRRK